MKKDNATDVRKGEELPLEKLKQYLDENLPDSRGEIHIRQFPSGFSNLTYLIRQGEKEYVLRRPPFGANIKSGHDMSREYKILSNLYKVYPKVPKPVLFCEDKEVLGADFYLMERVEGIIIRGQIRPKQYPDRNTMSGIAEAFVETFAQLHEVDFQVAGLGDLGKPEGYVARQIAGWTKRYFKAKTDEIDPIEKMAKWLDENQPADSGAALIHNDFKYDNIVLDKNNPKNVIAVLDWELATLGDPLMDLGSTLGYWVNDNDPDFMKKLGLSPTTIPGNPTRNELVKMYAEKRNIDVSNIVFYYVYGLFKLAVIVQQIYARYKKGLTKDERFANLNQAVMGCGQIGLQAILKNDIDDLF